MLKMKFLLLFVLVLGVSADISAGVEDQKVQGLFSLGSAIPDIINGIIKTALNSMRSVIPEPLNMALLNISLPYGDVINGSFMLSDLVETGARNFNASSVTTNVLKSTLNVVLDFPSINLNTNYFSDILIGSILPMYGEGPANIRFKNLRLNLTSKYKLNILKLQMQVHNTSLLLSLGDAVFDLHGMINNEAFSILSSQILDDTVNVFINKHSVLISKLISPAIESVVNKVLPGGNKNKTVSAESTQPLLSMLSLTQPMPLKDEQIMELRQLFVEELMKHPLVSKLSKFVST